MKISGSFPSFFRSRLWRCLVVFNRCMAVIGLILTFVLVIPLMVMMGLTSGMD